MAVPSSCARYPLTAALEGKPMHGILRHGSQLWFGCDLHLCVEDGGRISIFGPESGLPEDSWDGIAVCPGRDGVGAQPQPALPQAAGQSSHDPGKTGHWIQHVLGRHHHRQGWIGDGSHRPGAGDPERRRVDRGGPPAGFAQRHDQRRAGRSRGLLVDWSDRRGPRPMARQGRVGILDRGAGPAVGFDLEHPAGPERSPLGRDFPRLGAPGWAVAANHLDQEGRPRGRQRPMAGRDLRRLHLGRQQTRRFGAPRTGKRKNPSG